MANDSIPQLSLESSSRLNGELFCSKVELANAQDLSSIQFALRWNSEKIAFQHFNIIDPQLLGSNFGIDDTHRGVLYFSKKNETQFSTARQSLFEHRPHVLRGTSPCQSAGKTGNDAVAKTLRKPR